MTHLNKFNYYENSEQYVIFVFAGNQTNDQEGIYEPVIGHLSCSTNYDDDMSWGSSEFESYDEDEEEEENVEEQTTQRNSQVIEVKVTHRSSKNIEVSCEKFLVE